MKFSHPTDGQRTIVYPVGLLDELINARARWSDPRPGAKRKALRSLLYGLRYLGGASWRARKNYFNGYLAEPTPFPEGVRRCGSGWTRKRALRSLYRNAARCGVDLAKGAPDGDA